MVKISNIYYMLAYAFRSINADEISLYGKEEFENIHELFAEILIKGLQKQLKRGLPRQYTENSDELSTLHGKIDIQTSIRRLTMVRRRLFCDFDEFTEDTPGNRLIKCAITYLLKQNDVSSKRKRFLKYLHSNLSNVANVNYIKVPLQRIGGAEYVMLINLCQFLLDGMLMNTNGGYKMRGWLADEAMSSLYQRFLLKYFTRHYPHFDAHAAKIKWDMQGEHINMPEMNSDVYLSHGGKTLIIEAKFYKRILTEHITKKTFHSNNLYQIYAYVKNADKAKDGNISGMLLYAMTDEDIPPNTGMDTIIGGNNICVNIIDLRQDFSLIRSQLDSIAARLA